MAYIKIFPIKATVDKAVDYITNPDKTEEQLLVSSFGCSPETAELEFAMTHDAARMQVQDRDSNLARHLIISFKPGEITDPNVAHEVATKIADATLKGKHEYVLSTHVDKDHVHCHLIFNATNFVDYHKYVSNKRNYHKICKLSNRICREYGLEESMPTGQKAKSYKENMEYKRGKQLMELGLGMSAVVEFYDKVQSGIKGTISIERPFGYNVDVTIAGRDLLEFIETAYPTKLTIAKEIISGNETALYTLVGYDMS